MAGHHINIEISRGYHGTGTPTRARNAGGYHQGTAPPPLGTLTVSTRTPVGPAVPHRALARHLTERVLKSRGGRSLTRGIAPRGTRRTRNHTHIGLLRHSRAC